MEKNKETQKQKNAKIIKLKTTIPLNPLSEVMRDLEKINQALNSHWKKARLEDQEEEEDLDNNWLIFS